LLARPRSADGRPAGPLTEADLPCRQRALDTGCTMVKDVPLAYLGFGQPPAYAEESAVQNRISFLYNQHAAPTSRPYQDQETTHRAIGALCGARIVVPPDNLGQAVQWARVGF
jgi:hypothetical protein